MVFRSPQKFKNNGVTPIRVGPQGPLQSIFKDFTQKFDIMCSFVFYVNSVNLLLLLSLDILFSEIYLLQFVSENHEPMLAVAQS